MCPGGFRDVGAGSERSAHRHRQRYTGRGRCGAVVHVSSPALIGGPAATSTNEKKQWRFPVLPAGTYVIQITNSGFASHREEDIELGAGAALERTVVLQLAAVVESVVVKGEGSRLEARHPGFGTRFDAEDIRTISTRRSSMFDFIRAAPGISPTSPSSGTVTTVSAFGSGINANMFLIDGTNFTCPCIGIARSEPGIDFIQEIQIQSVGASAEYGNLQGAVILWSPNRAASGSCLTRLGIGRRPASPASPYGCRFATPVRKAVTNAACTVTSRRTSAVLLFTTSCGSSLDTAPSGLGQSTRY